MPMAGCFRPMSDWFSKRIGGDGMKAIGDHIAAAYAAGRIAYQHCSGCGQNQIFARDFCVTCLRPEPEWREAGGIGRIVACTTMHRAPTSEWKARLPYAIALVDIAEGLRVMALADSNLCAGDTARLRDQPVHNLPYFEPMVKI